MPPEYSYIKLVDNLSDVKYTAYVIFTHHPIFQELNWTDILTRVNLSKIHPLVLDINGYLFNLIGSKYSSIVYKKI